MENKLSQMEERVRSLERLVKEVTEALQDHANNRKNRRTSRPKSIHNPLTQSEVRAISGSNSSTPSTPTSSAPSTPRSSSSSSLVAAPPDPPQSCVPPLLPIFLTPVLTFIKPLLQESFEKKSFLAKMIHNTSDVVRILEARDCKAQLKYGHSLSVEDEGDGLVSGIQKLADTVFHLTHMIQNRKKHEKFPLTQEQKKNLSIFKSLQQLIQTVVKELN